MSALDPLLTVLDLAPEGSDRFRASNLDVGLPWIFGGQIVAQALMAAAATAGNRSVYSLHGHFLEAGNPDAPLVYQVERTRDGGTFTTRTVQAQQTGGLIFSAIVSLKDAESGLEHQAAVMPDAPPPDDLPGGDELRSELSASAPSYLRRYWDTPSPIELRPVLLNRYRSRDPLKPRHLIWFRSAGKGPDDPVLDAAILAFASDMTLLDTALFPHGRTVFDADMQIASLDHALWFHRPFRADDWLLFAQESPTATAGLGLVNGHIFGRDGRLVASVAQQGLIRPRGPAASAKS